jgi:hypothetical protein
METGLKWALRCAALAGVGAVLYAAALALNEHNKKERHRKEWEAEQAKVTTVADCFASTASKKAKTVIAKAQHGAWKVQDDRRLGFSRMAFAPVEISGPAQDALAALMDACNPVVEPKPLPGFTTRVSQGSRAMEVGEAQLIATWETRDPAFAALLKAARAEQEEAEQRKDKRARKAQLDAESKRRAEADWAFAKEGQSRP